MDIIKEGPIKPLDPTGKWVTRAFFILLWAVLLYPLWRIVGPI